MRRILATVGFLAFVALIVIYAAGGFAGRRIEPGRGAERAGEAAPPRIGEASRASIDLFEEAVGTVRSRTSVALAAQVGARVMEVAAEAGATVTRGQLLARLDDRELRARLAQSKEALTAAEAALASAQQAKESGSAVLAQAVKRFDRVRGFFEQKASTPEQMEQAESSLRQAQAGLADAEANIAAAQARIEQARQVVAEAEIGFGHATIASPIDGVVAERSVEPGDLAWPGRVLLVVLDPLSLRLEAEVREGLIGSVRKGAEFPVEIPAVGAAVRGRVSEVIPSADPRSRTFRVRVEFDPPPGSHPGMFGRLRLPVGKREVVRIPAEAVEEIGQLETVRVREGERWERRLVATGQKFEDGTVEVLSGLRGGESVGLPAESR